MLPRELRLPSQQIRHVLKTGFSISIEGLSLKAIKTSEITSRFAIIVLKKAAKSSVKRNEVKRIMKDYLRSNYKNVQGSVDVVFFVRTTPPTKSELQQKIDILINKIHK